MSTAVESTTKERDRISALIDFTQSFIDNHNFSAGLVKLQRYKITEPINLLTWYLSGQSIYIGSMYDAQKLEELKLRKISHVVSIGNKILRPKFISVMM